MALAKKCDICGVFYEHDVNAKRNAIRFCKTTSLGVANNDQVMDCCPECISEIEACLERCKNRPEVK